MVSDVSLHPYTAVNMIISFVRVLYLFNVHPVLGPLQLMLKRMFRDVAVVRKAVQVDIRLTSG